MLRMLRGFGILVFSVLIGLSAHAIHGMYENGELLERYNSARKANITLLVFSTLAIGALGYFEIRRIRTVADRPRYGHSRYKEERDGHDRLETSNIYSAPKTIDGWQGRRTRTPGSRKVPPVEVSVLWFGLLKACAIAIPLIYTGIFLYHYIFGFESTLSAWVVPAFYLSIISFSIPVAYGVIARKSWGLKSGYALAICNLLVFPYGTAIGLLLLMGLVGAAPAFVLSEQKKRQESRRKIAAI